MVKLLKIVGMLCIGLLGLSACGPANLTVSATMTASPVALAPTTALPTVYPTLASSRTAATLTVGSPTVAPSATADVIDVRPQFLYSYASW